MSSPDVCVAILAHNNRPMLDESVRTVRKLEPDASVVVFNGGGDRLDTTGLDADVCPASRRLRYTNLGPFQAEVMRWLVSADRVPRFLVTMDSDALQIRGGLAESLPRRMPDSAYMGVRFHRGLPGWKDTPLVRRARWKWQEGWARLLESEEVYHSFNAVQVYGAEYVERLARLPQLDEIIARSEVSRLRGLEEMIYPTLAVAMGCRPVQNPGGRAVQLRWHGAAELLGYLDDEDVHWVHRVSMDADASDRRLLKDAEAGTLRPAGEYADTHTREDLLSRLSIHTERFFRRRKLDLLTAVLPEIPRQHREHAAGSRTSGE